MLPHRTLGRTNLSVSVVGLGTAPAAFLKTDATAFAGMINALLDAGMNVLDTAAMYPGSEDFIGTHLAGRRADYVLISKCGNNLAGSSHKPWSAGIVTESVEVALRKLKTDHLDVMLLHSCDLATLQNGEAINALVKARDAGKVKHVGYSGDNEAVAWAAAQGEIEVVETSINLADQANIDGLLPVAREKNVGVIAKRPIANAAWKDISTQQGMYKNYAKVYTERLKQMELDKDAFGGLDWPEIALRFTLGFPEVSTAVIGTTNPANATANLTYADKGPLPADVVTMIRTAFKHADSDGKWTGQT